MIEPEPLQQVGTTCVRFRGRKLIYFSGCDYFRLSRHRDILAALQAGASKYGLNVAASRLTTGNHRLYAELESKLKQFFAAPDALLVPDGYVSNLITAQALAGNFSHALVDEHAHPSLLDAASLLDCPIVRFKHRNVAALSQAVIRCGEGSKLILLTDGLFSHNGAVAPLREYLTCLPRDAVMLVDDAHGAGVLGKTGKGSLEYARVSRGRVIQTITLSKAFGVYGGAILGNKPLRHRILDRSRMFVGSTPLPLPLVNACLKVVAVLASNKGLRRRLGKNSGYVHEALLKGGFPVVGKNSPIAALFPRDDKAARIIERKLLESGIYPPYIHYPSGSSTGYFRFVISSEHTPSELNALVEGLHICQPALFKLPVNA
jgi:7-keto-8-aminopelargonate synthetase-like enzyme